MSGWDCSVISTFLYDDIVLCYCSFYQCVFHIFYFVLSNWSFFDSRCSSINIQDIPVQTGLYFAGIAAAAAVVVAGATPPYLLASHLLAAAYNINTHKQTLTKQQHG